MDGMPFPDRQMYQATEGDSIAEIYRREKKGFARLDGEPAADGNGWISASKPLSMRRRLYRRRLSPSSSLTGLSLSLDARLHLLRCPCIEAPLYSFSLAKGKTPCRPKP